MSTRYRYTPEQLVSPAKRRSIFERDQRTCQYCGKHVPDPRFRRALCVDHVIPAALGGVGQPYNLVTACAHCNISKGRRVWVPRNLAGITAQHPDWRDRVVAQVRADALPTAERFTERIGFATTASQVAAIKAVLRPGEDISGAMREAVTLLVQARIPPGEEFSDWVRRQLLSE